MEIMHKSTIKSQFKKGNSELEIKEIKKFGFGVFSIKGFKKLKTKNKPFICVGQWNGGECVFDKVELI